MRRASGSKVRDRPPRGGDSCRRQPIETGVEVTTEGGVGIHSTVWLTVIRSPAVVGRSWGVRRGRWLRLWPACSGVTKTPSRSRAKRNRPRCPRSALSRAPLAGGRDGSVRSLLLPQPRPAPCDGPEHLQLVGGFRRELERDTLPPHPGKARRNGGTDGGDGRRSVCVPKPPGGCRPWHLELRCRASRGNVVKSVAPVYGWAAASAAARVEAFFPRGSRGRCRCGACEMAFVLGSGAVSSRGSETVAPRGWGFHEGCWGSRD